MITKSIMKILYKNVNDLKNKGMSDNEINQKIDSLKLDEIYSNIIIKASKDTCDFFKRTMYEKVFENKIETNQFLAHHEKIWGKCFIASEAMYIMTVEQAEQYCEWVIKNIKKKERKAKQFKFMVLKNLHARACQQYLEILFLIRHGFADGAYARWRSMYELSCISQFINDNDESVAKAYLEQSNSEDGTHNWAKAAQCFNGKKGNINFNDIQKECALSSEPWQKQYKLACKIVHASSQGTFGRLGNKKTLNSMSVGHSDYGIVTPAEHSAIDLARISTLFFSIFPNEDCLIITKCLEKWVDVIRDFYIIQEKQVFGDKK